LKIKPTLFSFKYLAELITTANQLLDSIKRVVMLD